MRLAIIALSARIYTQLARQAGHKVLAMDAYGDRDTIQAAQSYWCVPSLDNLTEADFFDMLAQLEAFAPEAVLVGAWFEHQIAFYARLTQAFRVLGVAPNQLHHMKYPEALASFCQQHQIDTPKIARQLPVMHSGQDWLFKHVGGSGGQHIQRVSDHSNHCERADDTQPRSDSYWQQFQPGQAIGALVLVSPQDYLLIGVHALHQHADGFQYAGASTLLDPALYAAVRRLCDQCWPDLGGIGLMSIDAIYADDTLHLIDINPRLSASMRLYQDWPLIDMHLSVCMGLTVAQAWSKPSTQVAPTFYSQRIAYTKSALNLSQLSYPDWVEDQPSVTNIPAGQPCFSLVAAGDSLTAMMQSLNHQQSQLVQQWGTYVCNNIEFNIH